jgi:hypothetical protein
MQGDLSELMKEGRKEGENERRGLGLRSTFGHQGASPSATLSQKMEGILTSSTGLRTRTETVDDMEDEEVIFGREKAPKRQPPQQYRSRWMKRQQTATIGTQTMTANPANLIIKMEGLNLAQQRETELQQEILRGSLWQERLKKQLEECSRKRRQELATATNVDGGTSCRGTTALRQASGPDDNNTDDWQAELLHDIHEDTFMKLDNLASDIDEMATRERWIYCRSCKRWHTVPCSRTSSKFLMLSILGLLLQTRPMSAELQGKSDYSIAPSHGVAVFEHRFDALLDASSTIIMIEMPFLHLRGEMAKLRKDMDKASVEYDQERELYASMLKELTRFDITLSSTVEALAEWLGGLLGLYNTVKVKQIEVKEDSTREALKTALVHLNAMDLHEKEEEKSIREVIDKLEDTRNMIFRGSKATQAKDSWHKVRELVQAFIKVGNTAVEHRVDPAIFDLVDMPGVWNKLQDKLGQEGKKTAVRRYQNILQPHASFWAEADTLHVAVVVSIMRTEATIFAAYKVRIPPVLAGNRLAYLQLDEEVLLVHRATGTIAQRGDMDECIEVDATRYCKMAYVLEDKAEPSCQGAVWRLEWSEATQRCPIRMVRARATVWALEKDEFWVVLPNTTECTFTCGTKPPQTRQLEGQHRVRLGEKCGMSSMHFSLRPATQADGRKITIRQALVNLTVWQTAMPEEKIFRATPISNNDYQRRARAQLEKGESGQNWPLIILATVLAILGVGVVVAGSAAFMFRRRIAMELVAATVAPRTTEETATLVPRRTEETEGQEGDGDQERGERAEIAGKAVTYDT